MQQARVSLQLFSTDESRIGQMIEFGYNPNFQCCTHPERATTLKVVLVEIR